MSKEVETYRLDQVEKSLEKFVERIEGKIDRLAETFATRAALELAIQESNAKMNEFSNNLTSLSHELIDVKKKKTFTTTLSVTVAIVSAMIMTITLYELLI